MDKIIKDGHVAVAVSYGFGAGWSTWSCGGINPMDAQYNQFFLDDRADLAAAKAHENGFYVGGADDVQIVWVPVGAHFKINEYDGSESLELRDGDQWLVA